jgi:hypothetical protein
MYESSDPDVRVRAKSIAARHSSSLVMANGSMPNALQKPMNFFWELA